MAEAATTGNLTNNTAAAPSKSRKLLVIILAVAVLAIGGGGSGYFFFQRGKAAAKGNTETARGSSAGRAKANAEEEVAEEPAEDATSKKGQDKTTALSLPDDSAVKQVIELQPYIVNLADPGEARYLRLTVSIGLGGELSEGEKPSPLFTARIRNAMLAMLTTKTSQEVLTLEGKAKLRRDLLRAARAASSEPKVEAIYITEFIIQL